MLSGAGVRILLIGTAQHTAGSELPELPTVATTITALATTFVECCEARPEQVRTLLNPASPLVFGQALTAAGAEANDVLVVCYLGHGLLDAHGELYLATQATNHLRSGLTYTALSCATLFAELAHSRARSIVVVLDCCFSGRVVGSPYPAYLDGFATSRPPGSYLLASAAPEEVALAPTGERYTAFTGELIRLLHEGDPTSPPELTFDHLYGCLDRVLPEQGRPRPRRYAAGRIGELTLAPNPAYRPPVQGKPPPPGETAVCPYRGLASYDVADAPYFFGREELTRRLIARLAEQLTDGGVLVVVGPSGSGKSSLLRAGLIPALDDGLPSTPGSWAWPRLVFTPGSHPIATLAYRLAQPAGERPDILHARLAADPAELNVVAAEVLARHARAEAATARRLVLVIDQFEELFTTCADPQERRAFLDALSTAAGQAVLVVLGLRADFYAQSMAEPQLTEALQRSQLIVTPMSNQELQTVIEGPAARAGLAVEPGLVTLMLRDLRTHDNENTSGLPLLSHALLATWQHREGNLLTLASYEATGGVWRAVTRTAESLYSGLIITEQDTARRMLLRMVHLGTSAAEDTRRRVQLADLLETETTAQVLTAFAAARLVTLGTDTAEISHEALLRAWPRLAQWIEDDRDGLRTHQLLSEAAAAWEQAGRDPSGLYRGARLATARTWAASNLHEGDLNIHESAFLAASTEQESRAVRRNRTLLAVLSTLFVIALTGAVIALHQTQAAHTEEQLSIARQLVAQADTARDTDPHTALLLGIAAQRIYPDRETQASLLNTLSTTHYVGALPGHNGAAVSVAFSDNRRTLATGTGDGTVVLWDLTDPARPHRLGPPLITQGGSVVSVTFSPYEPILATSSIDNALNGTVTLWDLTNPTQPHRLGEPLTGGDLLKNPTTFFPAKNILLTTSMNGPMIQWDITNPARPQRIGQFLTPGSAVLVASNRTTLVTSDGFDGVAALWDLTQSTQSPRLVRLPIRHIDGFYSLALSPNGVILAAGDADAVTLWDLTNPTRPTSIGSPMLTSDRVDSIAFSSDGTTLASRNVDGTVILWDVSDLAHPKPISQPLANPTIGVISLAFSRPDGSTLATGTSDGTVILWDVTNPAQPHRLGPPLANCSKWATEWTAFSPNGHILANECGGVILWDVINPAQPHRLGPPLDSYDLDSPLSIAFAPGRNILATSTDSGLWDLTDPRQPRRLVSPQTDYSTGGILTFSPNGTILATNGNSDTVTLWDITDPTQPRRLVPALTGTAGGWVLPLAFSPNGHILAGGEDETVILWDLSDLARPRRLGQPLMGNVAQVLSVVFSPNGKTLATRDASGTVILWDVTNPVQPRPLGAPLTSQGDDESVAFSPDGTTLATGDQNNTITLWDITDLAQPRRLGQPLPNLSSRMASMAFSPNGTTLSIGNSDGTVTLWDLTALNHLRKNTTKRACSITGRGLNRDEWARYIPGLPYQNTCLPDMPGGAVGN